MALKLFRAAWFLSMLVVFADLMFTYASLPENVLISEEGGEQVSMGREALFYVMVAGVLVVNVLVYLIAKMFRYDENFRAWFHGLIVTINLFFVIALSHLGTVNSAEKFDYSSIGFMIYSSIALMVLWAISWPIYLLYQKIFIKQAV